MKEHESTYVKPGQKFDVGVARHNVEDLLELDPQKALTIQSKYMQRFGHVPQGGKVDGILIPKAVSPHQEVQDLYNKGIENTKAQAAYFGELTGDSERFQIFTPETLTLHLDKNGGNALISPYLHNGKFGKFLDDNNLRRPDVTVSALPSEIVHDLKDKGAFHNLVKEARNPDFAVPHHEVVKVEDMAAKAGEFMRFEDELYEEIGMPAYKKGIFGRLSFSDGGFGSFNAHEKNGKVILETDDKKDHEPYETWKDALTDAQGYLLNSNGDNGQADVVISRSIKLRDVPGLSMFFIDGDVLPLGFNGQILDERTKACVGTETYRPTDPYIRERKKEFEDRTTEATKSFVHDLARKKGLNPETFRGPMNVDEMILGDEELEVQKRIIEGLNKGTLSTGLKDKLEKYGQLEKSSDFFFAESNPRRTNFVEAIDEVILVEGLPQTVNSMKSVIQKGIRAEDYHPLPKEGIAMEDLTEELLKTYTADDREDGMVILRTRPIETPKPGETGYIGVIMTGNVDNRRGELQAIFEDTKKKKRAA